jgi:hypothetical protein
VDSPSGQIRLNIPQADRKRNAGAPAREAPSPIKIAQDDVGGVLVRDRQFRYFLLEGECQGDVGQKIRVAGPLHRPLVDGLSNGAEGLTRIGVEELTTL